jgi:hypothetical protein
MSPLNSSYADRSGDAQRPLNGAAAALRCFGRRTAPPEPADRLDPFGTGHPPPCYPGDVLFSTINLIRNRVS